MSSIECLREFVIERLSAAAVEIFGVFHKTIVEYEEEIDRQRRLLDIFLKPEIKLQRIELPQQHVCKGEGDLTDQQLCNEERSSSLDQEDSEPPQIKEEEEELYVSQEAELPELKQATDAFMLTPTYEESDHSEPELNCDHQLLYSNSRDAKSPDKKADDQEDPEPPHLKEEQEELRISQEEEQSKLCAWLRSHTELPQQHVCKEEEALTDQQLCDEEKSSGLDQEDPEPPQIKEEQEKLCTSQEGKRLQLRQETDSSMLTPTCKESEHSEPELNSDRPLFSNDSHVAESQDQRGGEHQDPASIREVASESQNHHQKSALPDWIYWSTRGNKRSYVCDTCGRDCKSRSRLSVHVRTHTGERPYSCNTCGKRFMQKSVMQTHFRTHTGERPYSCNTCGKRFAHPSGLKNHSRIHTGERPYSCKICGKAFRSSCQLPVHTRRAHTLERPFGCNQCGKRFFTRFSLRRHLKVHAEKQSSVV